MRLVLLQVEVSAEYAVMVTERVLNASNIIEAIIRGPATDKLFAIMRYCNLLVCMCSHVRACRSVSDSVC